MAEIKTPYTKEQIAEYLKENNLDVLNSFQIWAKLMEIEVTISELILIIKQMNDKNNFYKSTVVKNGDGTEAKDNFVSTANEDHN